MKTGNYAGRMLAGEWRRELQRFQAAWRTRRRAEALDLERFVAGLKKRKPKDLGAFRRAVVALRKKMQHTSSKTLNQ
jgi:hypothetical protein